MPKEVEITLPVEEIPGGGDPSQVVPPPDEPGYQVFYPGDEIPPDPSPEPSEAEKRIAELEAKLAEQSRQSVTLESGFGALAETLKELKTTPAPAAQPTQPLQPFDLEKFKETVKEKSYDDPVEANLMIQQAFLKPQMDAIDRQMKEMAYQQEKLTVAQNPDYASIMGKWGGEVDAMATQLGKGPGSVERAVQIVRGNHFNDIMAEAVAAEVAKQAAQVVKPAIQPSYTGVTTTPTPTSAVRKQKIQLSDADIAEMECSLLSQDAWIQRELKAGRWK